MVFWSKSTLDQTRDCSLQKAQTDFQQPPGAESNVPQHCFPHTCLFKATILAASKVAVGLPGCCRSLPTELLYLIPVQCLYLLKTVYLHIYDQMRLLLVLVKTPFTITVVFCHLLLLLVLMYIFYVLFHRYIWIYLTISVFEKKMRFWPSFTSGCDPISKYFQKKSLLSDLAVWLYSLCELASLAKAEGAESF